MRANKKAPALADTFLEEHLEKSSPLIIEEIARWRDLLWEDYNDYKSEQPRLKEMGVP